MPLINCTECGKQVSTEAKACPNCGRPVATMQASLPVASITCPYCRKDVASGVETCPHCRMRIAHSTSSKRFRRANDPVEIQQKQLYWIRLVGVIVAVC